MNRKLIGVFVAQSVTASHRNRTVIVFLRSGQLEVERRWSENENGAVALFTRRFDLALKQRFELVSICRRSQIVDESAPRNCVRLAFAEDLSGLERVDVVLVHALIGICLWMV